MEWTNVEVLEVLELYEAQTPIRDPGLNDHKN